MDGIELMASAMQAAMAHLDTAASNLANVSTDGFRRSVTHPKLTGSGIVNTTTRDTGQAPLRHTGRPLDLAVAGNGSFFVRDAQGRLFPERSGSFQADAHGRLVDENGRFLMGKNAPLVLNEGDSITEHVRVRPGTQLESGFLAGANVDAIHEMVDVLGAQRAFETAQKTLSALDDVRSKATGEVARVKS